jgi:hypothetical protein
MSTKISSVVPLCLCYKEFLGFVRVIRVYNVRGKILCPFKIDVAFKITLKSHINLNLGNQTTF